MYHASHISFSVHGHFQATCRPPQGKVLLQDHQSERGSTWAIVGGVLAAVLSCVLAAGAFIVFQKRRPAGTPDADAENEVANKEVRTALDHCACAEQVF